MMENIEDQIQQFFEEYEERFATGLGGEDVAQETANAFAGYFVEASPAGVIGGQNDAGFQAKVPQGYDFYRSIGITKMEIRQIDITPLDDLHYMVDISWESFYTKDGSDDSVEFNVIYFLQNREGSLKIFSYITGDEQGVLKERGLVG